MKLSPILLALTFGTATAAEPYPLKTCLVSDDKLSEHTKAYTFQYQGTIVRLCCSDCMQDFKKQPATYMAKIKAAAKK
jgi:YHS domain-containing protein